MQELVSIIIPVYNCEKYIIRCLDSIYRQDYENIEIIVIDDGSTDRTAELIEKGYLKKIKFIKQNNIGAPKTRNRGLSMAQGTYIIFFDSDDVMCPGAIRCLVETMKREKTDLVMGNYGLISEDNLVLEYNIKEINFSKKYTTDECAKFIYDMAPFPDNKLYKKSIIDHYNISFDDVRVGQDLNFFLKYFSHTQNVFIVNQKLCDYRIVSTSISRTYDERICDIIQSIDGACNHMKKWNTYKRFKILMDKEKILHSYNQMNKCIKIENFKKRKEIAKYLFKANRKNLIGNFVISKKIVLIKIKFFIKYILCLFPGKIIL